MFGAVFRILKPVRLIKRRALMKGVFGGDRTWLMLGAVVWLGGRVKALFGFGDPEPVYTEEVTSGDRIVVVHSEANNRRRRRRR